MQEFILSKPQIAICLIFASIATTLIYDFSGVFGFTETVEWIAFTVALPLRLFTYAALFVSCGLVALHLKGNMGRTTALAAVWSFIGLALCFWMWWVLSSDPNIGQGYALKRFTPDTLADFAPGWTMAEVAIGKVAAARYTWFTAMGFEAVAIIAASTITSLYLHLFGTSKRYVLALFAPIVAMFVLVVYGLYFAPWSYTYSFDDFFGDALVGTMLFNAGPYLLLTPISGGFTAPAIWVALIALVNVAFLGRWSNHQTA